MHHSKNIKLVTKQHLALFLYSPKHTDTTPDWGLWALISGSLNLKTYPLFAERSLRFRKPLDAQSWKPYTSWVNIGWSTVWHQNHAKLFLSHTSAHISWCGSMYFNGAVLIYPSREFCLSLLCGFDRWFALSFALVYLALSGCKTLEQKRKKRFKLTPAEPKLPHNT